MPRNAVDRLEGGRGVREDALPEHTVYKDDGCGHGCVRSLECPFPRCRYDDPLLWQRLERAKRDRQIVVARGKGLTVEAVAERFKISRRTVHRILAQAQAGKVKERAAAVPKRAA